MNLIYYQIDRSLKKITEQVKELYTYIPTSVQSDDYLLKYYRKIFGSTVNKESSIKRSGRNLRRLCRMKKCNHSEQCFIRDEKHTLIAVEQEQAYIKIYSRC